jgi:hypothetical protein
VGRAAHAQGWIVFFGIDDATAPAVDAERIGAALLDRLERRMAPLGLGKLSVIVSDTGHGVAHLTGNGFEVRHQLRYFERPLPAQRRELDLLKGVGGRILPRHLWRNVAGMARARGRVHRRGRRDRVAPRPSPEPPGASAQPRATASVLRPCAPPSPVSAPATSCRLACPRRRSS